MGECGTSVVLQWAKHRSGIDLVASRSEETTAIVAAEIVTERSNRAAVIGDAAGVKDNATELQSPGHVGDPAAGPLKCRVIAECAIEDLQRRAAVDESVIVDATTKATGRVAAEGTVENVRWRTAAVGTDV